MQKNPAGAKKSLGTFLIVAGFIVPFITVQIGIRIDNDIIGVFGGVILFVLFVFFGLDLRRSARKAEKTSAEDRSKN